MVPKNARIQDEVRLTFVKWVIFYWKKWLWEASVGFCVPVHLGEFDAKTSPIWWQVRGPPPIFLWWFKGRKFVSWTQTCTSCRTIGEITWDGAPSGWIRKKQWKLNRGLFLSQLNLRYDNSKVAPNPSKFFSSKSCMLFSLDFSLKFLIIGYHTLYWNWRWNPPTAPHVGKQNQRIPSNLLWSFRGNWPRISNMSIPGCQRPISRFGLGFLSLKMRCHPCVDDCILGR